jgi:hypothetical protein
MGIPPQNLVWKVATGVGRISRGFDSRLDTFLGRDDAHRVVGMDNTGQDHGKESDGCYC